MSRAIATMPDAPPADRPERVRGRAVYLWRAPQDQSDRRFSGRASECSHRYRPPVDSPATQLRAAQYVPIYTRGPPARRQGPVPAVPASSCGLRAAHATRPRSPQQKGRGQPAPGCRAKPPASSRRRAEPATASKIGLRNPARASTPPAQTWPSTSALVPCVIHDWRSGAGAHPSPHERAGALELTHPRDGELHLWRCAARATSCGTRARTSGQPRLSVPLRLAGAGYAKSLVPRLSLRPSFHKPFARSCLESSTATPIRSPPH